MIGSGSGESVQGGIASHPAFTFAVSVPIMPTFVGLAKFSVGGASLPAGVGAGGNGISGSAFPFAKQGTPAGNFPLSPVGGGGSAAFNLGFVPDPVLLGATWQGAAGVASPIVFSTMAAALAIPITATAPAYDNRTAGGRGIVQFVATATGVLGPGLGTFPVFGTLTLSYTPEPGTIVLLGSGIAGLAAFGRRKQRR